MIVLDIAIVILLLLTIGFCWRLNNRIAAVHESRDELTYFVSKFDRAMSESEKLFAELKSVNVNSQELRQQLKEARELAEELGYMREAAVRITERLESAITQSRSEGRSGGRSEMKNFAGEAGGEKSFRSASSALVSAALAQMKKGQSIVPAASSGGKEVVGRQLMPAEKSRSMFGALVAQVMDKETI